MPLRLPPWLIAGAVVVCVLGAFALAKRHTPRRWLKAIKHWYAVLRIGTKRMYHQLTKCMHAAPSIYRYGVLSIGTKLKHMYSFYTIASKVGSVYQLELPARVRNLLDTIERMVTLGIGALLDSPVPLHANEPHCMLTSPIAC